MVSKVFVTFVIISLLALQLSAAQQERKCVQGKYYFDGCNTCFCGYNGIGACTRRFCDPSETIPPPDDFWQTDVEQD
ncbi:Pacifastin domain-containing protein [Camponotus japonicus]